MILLLHSVLKWKNYVKSTYSVLYSIQCGKVLENAITLKNFPWNQLFSNFFGESVDLTENAKVLKMVGRKFARFEQIMFTGDLESNDFTEIFFKPNVFSRSPCFHFTKVLCERKLKLKSISNTVQCGNCAQCGKKRDSLSPKFFFVKSTL